MNLGGGIGSHRIPVGSEVSLDMLMGGFFSYLGSYN